MNQQPLPATDGANALDARRDQHVVRAPLTFRNPAYAGSVRYTGTPEAGDAYVNRIVSIADGRPVADRLSLDVEGFELRPHETNVANFRDKDEIRNVYYPEVDRLLKAATGASRVVIFDHTVRIEDEMQREDPTARGPVHLAHNDYTERSGPQRVRDLLEPADAEAFLRNRFAVINVWRSIEAPIETTPIAAADAQSIAFGDFVATDLVRPDRIGEIYQVTYSPEHRWYYFPKMRRNEVLLLKCYDAEIDGPARFTAHTAFENPEAPANAAPRKSIEVRTLVSFAP